MRFVSLLFSFHGRVTRSQYWLGTLAVNVLNWMIVLGSSMATSVTMGEHAKNPTAMLSALASQNAILLPVSLAVCWSGLALQVKRFHDRGQSGWWTLLPLAPCLLMIINIGSAVFEQWPPERLFSSLGLPLFVLLVISLGLFINLGCMAGTDGPNKYDGPNGGGPFSGTQPTSNGPGPAQANASAAFLMGGAEKAMERAIAEQTKPQAPAPRPQPAMRQPAMASPVPAGAPASFGRRAPR